MEPEVVDSRPDTSEANILRIVLYIVTVLHFLGEHRTFLASTFNMSGSITSLFVDDLNFLIIILLSSKIAQSSGPSSIGSRLKQTAESRESILQ
jgi:hypothetical protein